MDESSENRKHRLQALRMEASAQSLTPSSFSSTPTLQTLANPLVSPSPPSFETPPPVPRFDYYTDPMSAFSGDKRRSAGGGGGASPLSHPSSRPGGGQRNYQTPIAYHPPTHQFPVNQSPDRSPWRSPIRFPSPFSDRYGGAPSPTTPNFGAWNRSGGGYSGHGFPPNYSQRGGHGGNMSPHSNSGRGRGWQFTGSGGGGGSPSPGRRGGRGTGFRYDRGTSRQEPEHYYIKAMVKDPWRKLKPIVGNVLVPMAGSTSWLPQSISAPKRPKVDTSGDFKLRSGSLADYLAQSLEEAANDDV